MSNRNQPSPSEARNSSRLSVTSTAVRRSPHRFTRPLGVQLQIELGHFGDAEFAQGFSCPADGGRGRLFPGLLAGTDQLNDFVDTLSHVVLPFGIGQDAGAPAAGNPSIGIS